MHLERPLLGTWPAIQACALTGNRTSEPLVGRPALNPLSHTTQGYFSFLKKKYLNLMNFMPTKIFPEYGVKSQEITLSVILQTH